MFGRRVSGAKKKRGKNKNGEHEARREKERRERAEGGRKKEDERLCSGMVSPLVPG